MRLLSFFALFLAAPVLAYGPSDKNDAGCLVWDVNEVLDAGLMPLPDGGYVGPAGACIELVEVSGSYLRKRVPPKFDGPIPPAPPSTWDPVPIPSRNPNVRPLSPFDGDAGIAHPSGACLDGQGWSFESGTWEGWTPTGALAAGGRTGPVYGNNVHIERLHPPGYVMIGNDAGMDVTIGGDYWMFSRDVNQRGDYWLGTRDLRKNWTVFPGNTMSESSLSSVYSPTFIIGTNYLDFFLGGGFHTSQRVELQVQPQGGWTQAQLLAAFDGIGVSEFPPDYGTLSKLDGTWVVVRASSPRSQSNGENDFMGERIGWNVSQFKNLNARLRIVDAARSTPGLAHVNADHFRCTDSLDPKHQWLLKGNLQQAKVGQAVTEQPLWGATDLHAHVTSNLSFGGHMLWGDASDSLPAVYDCKTPLPAITWADGGIARAPIATPDVKTDCYVNVGMVVLANIAANSVCAIASQGLFLVPLVGPELAAEEIAVCTAAVTSATAALLTLPVMSNYSLHGALSPISGGLKLGDWLEAIAMILKGENFRQHGVIEELDFDLPDGTHSGHFGRLHQQYQYQMVTRAWQGGLRLVVLDSINGRALHALLDQVPPDEGYDDWDAIHDSVLAARRLVACPGNGLFNPGPLCGIADIAKTPQMARRIIAQNKVAIVLGTEVDELGKLRDAKRMALFGHPADEVDSPETQLKDLYAWGIRKITPIHAIDNPFGGTAIFNDIYPTSQQYHNLTRGLNGGVDGTWQDWNPSTDFYLPQSLGDQLGGLVLGTFDPGETLAANSGLPNNGFPVVDTSLPGETTIGGYLDITFRYGMGTARPMSRFSGSYVMPDGPVNTSGWIPMSAWGGIETTWDAEDRTPLKSLMRLNNLGWILGAAPLGTVKNSRCSLEDANLPVDLPYAERDAAAKNYQLAPLGHFNALGLTQKGLNFVHGMMEKGIAFDFDHLSQHSRLDAFAQTHQFAVEAGASSDYAPFGVHTSLRGVEKAGPVPLEYRDAMGVNNEGDRTKAELLLQRQADGVVSVTANATIVPYVENGSSNNNCDFSSKSWAQKYLAFMSLLKGRGLAMSTDMNGLTTAMASRYGLGACHTDRTNEDEIQTKFGQVQNWPRDFTVDGCTYNTAFSSTSPDFNWSCPGVKMIQDQHQEASAVIYDDYDASRKVGAPLNTVPLIERVIARRASEFRDDHGPRYELDEFVTIGASHQLYPIKKFKNGGGSTNTGWDFNLDGLKHIGMYPDFFQDVRNGGLTFEQLTPLFDSAESYVQMWEKNCAMATSWAVAHGTTAPQCTGGGEPWPSF